MAFVSRIGVLALAGLLVGAPAHANEVAAPAAQKPPATSAVPPTPKAVKPARPAKKIAVAALTPAPASVPFKPSQNLLNWYLERSSGPVVIPRGDRLVYCHGFDCKLRTTIALTGEDIAALEAIFATRRGSAAEERDGIDHAVQWWEKRAAPLLGGKPDIRGSEIWQSNQPGQTDCLDEATNSTTILIYLQQRGLLRYHHVTRPDSRGGFLYAHATAVFQEIGGKGWVVDSWMRDSGDPNDVMLHSEWLEKW